MRVMPGTERGENSPVLPMLFALCQALRLSSATAGFFSGLNPGPEQGLDSIRIAHRPCTGVPFVALSYWKSIISSEIASCRTQSIGRGHFDNSRSRAPGVIHPYSPRRAGVAGVGIACLNRKTAPDAIRASLGRSYSRPFSPSRLRPPLIPVVPPAQARACRARKALAGASTV